MSFIRLHLEIWTKIRCFDLINVIAVGAAGEWLICETIIWLTGQSTTGMLINGFSALV